MEREGLFELRRRTFDTPEFRGITFIEAEAKSVVNHVPGNFLPFKYTINPYRGCSHACVYCMTGETPILKADGRTKALADVCVGDEVYGTERRGSYRRYVRTTVLARSLTVKPAYRITLEDGTELVASGDHRFLSDRGWKHVTGCEQGACRRPFMTVNSKLIGTGKFAATPEHGREYRRGYVCGMIRGDAHLGSYSYLRAGRIAAVNRFRLALVDLEGLVRTQGFLGDLGVFTREFIFQEAVGARKAMHAIRNSSTTGVEAINEIVKWPLSVSAAWCEGFLAGIFDAEGSYSRGILRICNTDEPMIRWVTACLRRIRFPYDIEATCGRNGLAAVRLRGGLREHLRFFHTVDPAITRKRTIEGQPIKNDAPLKVASIDPLGFELPMLDITTGTGDFIANGVVSHNCFARVTHTYMDMDAGRDFETKIVVKVNAPQVLRRELGAKRWKGEHIAMGTATDPYQRAEGRYRLMPEIIRALTDYRNPFSILTKGTLILRDLPLLVDAAAVAQVSTALSIGTLDEDAWRKSEPGTPHPRRRMEAVAALNTAGIPCGVMVAPILPGITDGPEQLREVVRAAIDAGATHVSPILLHLRPVVKEEFMRWLEENYPDLVPHYLSMYRRSPYAESAERKALGGQVGSLVGQAGGLRIGPEIAARFRRSERWARTGSAASSGDDQLSLLD
jgi:DNA repair photolyase